MPYQHSNVYIVRVIDTDHQGETRTWFACPYGSTRADQNRRRAGVRRPRRHRTEEPEALRDRRCVVEALSSDDDRLRVADYGRVEHGSLY